MQTHLVFFSGWESEELGPTSTWKLPGCSAAKAGPTHSHTTAGEDALAKGSESRPLRVSHFPH